MPIVAFANKSEISSPTTVTPFGGEQIAKRDQEDFVISIQIQDCNLIPGTK